MKKTISKVAVFVLMLTLLLSPAVAMYPKNTKQVYATQVTDLIAKSTITVSTESDTFTNTSNSSTTTSYSVSDYIYLPSYSDYSYGKSGSTYGIKKVAALKFVMSTDCAIANYGGTTNYWWTRTASNATYVKVVTTSQDPNEVVIGIRPALQFNLGSLISAIGAGSAQTASETFNTTTFQTVTVDNLMYPQTIVTDSTLKEALDSIKDNNSYKTGKTYAGYTDASETTTGKGAAYYNEEYLYNGNYYVLAKEYARNTSTTYSDGTTAKQNNAGQVWIKVEPIKWVVAKGENDENETLFTNAVNSGSAASGDTVEVFSLYALTSGLCMYPNTSDTNRTSYAGSVVRAYLNGYDLRENQGDEGDNYKAITTDGKDGVMVNFTGNGGFLAEICHGDITYNISGSGSGSGDDETGVVEDIVIPTAIILTLGTTLGVTLSTGKRKRRVAK